MSSVPGTVEEIKVLISADSGKLTRELSSAEKAVLKARGVIQSASGGISGSSKAWTAYRTAAVTEMNRALEGVRKAQEKIAAIRSEIQATTFSDVEVESTIQQLLRNGTPDSQIASTVDAMQTPSPALQGQYAEAMAELQKYRDAAKEAGESVEWLNQKVAESQTAEQSQVTAAKEAALRAKEQARAAREAASAHVSNTKATNASGGGLARFGKTALFAMFGAATLYAGLRRLISAFLEAAKADSSLSTSLGQVKGNLSIAFQAVYQAALPALRALASILATVTSLIASFMSMLFNVSWVSASEGAQDYAKSVGAAGGAAKKAAQNMMAIDELNVMNSESGGGGSGGLSPIFGPPPEKPQWLIDLIEWLRPIIEAFERLWLAIKGFFEGIKEKLENSPGWQKFQEGLTAIRDAVIAVVDALAKLFADPTFQALVAGIIEIALYAVGTVLVIVAEIIQFIVALLNNDGAGAVEHLLKAFIEAGRFIMAIFITIYHAAVSAFQGIAIFINTFLADLFDMIGLDSLAEKIRGSIENIKKGIEENGAQFEIDLAINESSADEARATVESLFGGASESADETTTKLDTLDKKLADTKQTATETSTALTNALASTPTVEAAKQLGADLMAGLSQGIAENQALATTAMTDAMTAVTTAFQESMTTAVGSVDLASESTYQAYTDLGKTCADRFSEGFKSKLVDIAAETISDIQLRFQNMMTQLHYDLYNLTVAIMGDTRAMVLYINDWLGKITSKVTITLEFIVSGLGGGIDLGVTPGTGESGFGSTKPTLVLVPQMAASGGVFSSGQLIYAREAGPEIIGSLGGGRTGIMNNNQIVDSVSSGVYQAVVDAMATQSGDKGDFVVNVDGRELIRVTRSAERSSGYQISGNPTFAR